MITVGIGEQRVTEEDDAVLVTYSLGSCVALSLYDPAKKIGGLVHCMVPVSASDPDRARQQPELFSDTGVAALLQAVFDRGARRRSLIAKVAGGASLQNDYGPFRVGERNYTVVRRVLWRNGIFIAGEDVGGRQPRTMTLEMETGRTVVKSGGKHHVL